jgi:hypothetical protein
MPENSIHLDKRIAWYDLRWQNSPQSIMVVDFHKEMAGINRINAKEAVNVCLGAARAKKQLNKPFW